MVASFVANILAYSSFLSMLPLFAYVLCIGWTYPYSSYRLWKLCLWYVVTVRLGRCHRMRIAASCSISRVLS